MLQCDIPKGLRDLPWPRPCSSPQHESLCWGTISVNQPQLQLIPRLYKHPPKPAFWTETFLAPVLTAFQPAIPPAVPPSSHHFQPVIPPAILPSPCHSSPRFLLQVPSSPCPPEPPVTSTLKPRIPSRPGTPLVFSQLRNLIPARDFHSP